MYQVKHAWGYMVIGLGAWEALAFSPGPIPTISATIRVCHRRRKRITRMAVGIWLIALGAHLLDKKAFEEL